MSKTNGGLTTCLRSGYAALYAVTHEDERTLGTIKKACDELDFSLYRWTASVGIIKPDTSVVPKTHDPMAALSCFNKGEDHIRKKSVLIMQDLHLFLKKRDPGMTAMMKDAIEYGRHTSKSILVMACALDLPPELEKLFTVIEFSLPDKAELLTLAKAITKKRGVDLNGATDAILEAGSGLTTIEFSDAVNASITEHEAIVPEMVAEIKERTIKKGGILEVIKPGVTFDNIGGLHGLKAWIKKRKGAFTKKARDYGLPLPRGVCLFGVQGAGKSLATRAIASELRCPLIRLDAGRLFSQFVGSSESNVRAVIEQIEAFGFCCVQIDEIDKGFAGMLGPNGDSGTTRRVVGTFLTWMAEKTSPVFVIATANDVTQLPAELLRKGRWDEIFFIDLPTANERVETWRVQIKMKGRDPENFDLGQLATVTEGWTGAEIESLFSDGMYEAFDQGTEPDTALLVRLSKSTQPISVTMGESVHGLRKWAAGRARSASGEAQRKVAR